MYTVCMQVSSSFFPYNGPHPLHTLTPSQPSLLSPMSPLFKPIQDCLSHLQVSRKNLNHKQLIGEGAFGEVWYVITLSPPTVGK